MSSISEILRSAREQQNISLQEVEERTKIRGRILTAIENDELGMLPAPYMRSFVKTYAQYLKVPLEELAPQMDAAFASKTPVTATSVVQAHSAGGGESGRKKSDLNSAFNSPASSVLNKIIYAALSISVVVAGYYTLIKADPVNTKDVQGTSAAIQPLDIEQSADPVVEEAPLLSPAVGDSLILETIATDTVWLSIVVDGRKNTELTMPPGTKRRWVAEKKFNLSLGNAGGMKFIFNGQAVPPLGPKGYVIRDIRITSDGIVSSNRNIVTPRQQNEESGTGELANNDRSTNS